MLAEFCIFMGDLNYRLSTTFKELNNENRDKALAMVHTKEDQFIDAREAGYFVNYNEPKIDFLPTYKLKADNLQYVNKNNQAPSYCDKVLFRNNSSLEVVDDFYVGRHDIFGSDHRPVQRAMTIKNLVNPQYADALKIFDKDDPVMGYGEFDIQEV